MTLTLAILVALQGWQASVDSLAKRGDFSGVVLVARNGVPEFEHAYGMADREAGRPNTIETSFNVGSINKFFTQIAIRQLAAQGKLNLDSSLARAWPDYPNQDVAKRVTIRQILEFTSGIQGNIFAVPQGKTRHDVVTLDDYLQLFVNEPLQFEPGSQRQYSNAGYIVLGLLIEKLSGENYFEYVNKHIYEPAGMTQTGSWRVERWPANTAIGYTRGPGPDRRDDAPLGRNTDFLPGKGSSAGGGYSTAHDLLHLMNALRQHKIAAAPEAGMVGIAGGAPGLNATVDGDLPGGYDVIVLANLDPPAAERVGRLIRTALVGHP